MDKFNLMRYGLLPRNVEYQVYSFTFLFAGQIKIPLHLRFILDIFSYSNPKYSYCLC